jgi:hypothetical protein
MVTTVEKLKQIHKKFFWKLHGNGKFHKKCSLCIAIQTAKEKRYEKV